MKAFVNCRGMKFTFNIQNCNWSSFAYSQALTLIQLFGIRLSGSSKLLNQGEGATTIGELVFDNVAAHQLKVEFPMT